MSTPLIQIPPLDDSEICPLPPSPDTMSNQPQHRSVVDFDQFLETIHIETIYGIPYYTSDEGFVYNPLDILSRKPHPRIIGKTGTVLIGSKKHVIISEWSPE